jgi:hypothetical protein
MCSNENRDALRPERFAIFPLGMGIVWRSAVPGKRHKFRSEDVMGGLYLGIAITAEALVAMGMVIAFM